MEHAVLYLWGLYLSADSDGDPLERMPRGKRSEFAGGRAEMENARRGDPPGAS